MSLKMDLLRKGIESFQLDEIVHDAANKAASDANNNGIEGQITFLTDTLGWSEEDVKETLKNEGVL